jgi:hypothetical protein
MSARGLGATVNPFGNYPTPPHVFARFAEALRAAGETWLDDAEVIDEPCAGEGVLVGAIRAACPKAKIYASDIRPGLRELQLAAGASHAYTMCALHVAQYPYDGSVRNAVITNPDFELFADLLSTHRRYRAEVPIALLGRGSLFCGARERCSLLDVCGRPDVYMVPERPSFLRFRWIDEHGRKLDTGASDSEGVAWYVWPGGPPRARGIFDLLRPPSPEEETAWSPPVRVIRVAAADWEKRGKKAAQLGDSTEWDEAGAPPQLGLFA